MKNKNQIVECIPNFSEGRDLAKIEKIVKPFKNKKGVKLLGYERDEDYNRLVVTVIGEPDLVKALLPSVQEGLYDSQSFLQPFGGYEFNNQQVAKEGRAALANALQLRNKRKT